MSLSDERQIYAINKFRYLIAQSDGNCPITHDTIKTPAYTLCGHVFEFEALAQWRYAHENHIRCPFCNYMNPYALIYPTQAFAEYFIKRLICEYETIRSFELPYMKATG